MQDDDRTVLALARHIADRLRKELDDFAAETIVLTREDAALALGLIEGIAEHMSRPKN